MTYNQQATFSSPQPNTTPLLALSKLNLTSRNKRSANSNRETNVVRSPRILAHGDRNRFHYTASHIRPRHQLASQRRRLESGRHPTPRRRTRNSPLRTGRTCIRTTLDPQRSRRHIHRPAALPRRNRILRPARNIRRIVPRRAVRHRLQICLPSRCSHGTERRHLRPRLVRWQRQSNRLHHQSPNHPANTAIKP